MDIGRILNSICEAEESEPNNWQTSLAHNVWLCLNINSDGPEYTVCPSWRSTTDSPFTDLERLDTESPEEAINRFKTYLSFRDKPINPEYLPVFNEWQHQKFKIPPDPGLIFFTRAEYSLRRPGFRHLTVNRAFSRPSRSGVTRVGYTGPEADESIQIVNGQITRKIHTPNKDFGTCPDDPEECWKWVCRVLDRSDETEEITFITQYEEKLRELPWQDDLEVIYSL
jgi:hypothetical protein